MIPSFFHIMAFQPDSFKVLKNAFCALRFPPGSSGGLEGA